MSDQLLKTVLSAYPKQFAPREWQGVGSSGGFSGALIVKVRNDWGDWCLRGWPKASLPPVRLLGLHRLLRHVFERGVKQVAVPVAARTGETLVACAGRLWQVEPWMPGTADFAGHPTFERLTNAMTCLAAFHHATQFYRDNGPARAWFDSAERAISPTVNERLELLKTWQGGKLDQLSHQLPHEPRSDLRELGQEVAARFRTTAPLVGLQLDEMSRVPFRLQPCLRDVWHDHVLFTGGEVTGLIDASACRIEHVSVDLARLLGSFLQDDRERWNLALAAYETVHPLTTPERALLEAFDRSSVLLSGLVWLDRLVLQGEQVADWPRVFQRLETIQQRLQTLDRAK